jgi:hypothetical protein
MPENDILKEKFKHALEKEKDMKMFNKVFKEYKKGTEKGRKKRGIHESPGYNV